MAYNNLLINSNENASKQ